MNKRTSENRTCQICGSILSKWQKYTCSTECSNRRTRAATLAETKSPYRDVRVEKYTPQRRRCIETDSDQIAIKRAIDAKYGIGHDTGRVIEKGSIEWDAIVKTLTPVDRISRGQSMPPLAPSRYRAGGIAA